MGISCHHGNNYQNISLRLKYHPNMEIIKITWQYLKGDPMYNAYDRDIAVVNIFFGESTVFGERI